MISARTWAIIIALGWFALGSRGLYEQMRPASDFMVVRSVHVEGTNIGVAPQMRVDREIRRGFIGNWVADVERFRNGRFVLVCSAAGHGNYSPDNDLPDDLDLDWWTYPTKCTPTVPGQYRVSTRWRIEPPSGAVKEVEADSNVFEVRAR